MIFALATLLLVALGVLAGGMLIAYGEQASTQNESHVGMDSDLRTMHVRMFDENGTLLFSSWPNENGSLVDQYAFLGAIEPDGSIQVDWTKWPTTLAPLAPALRSTSGPGVYWRSMVLDHAPGTRQVFPSALELPSFGSVSRDEATRLFGYLVSNSTVQFAGRLPVYIGNVSNETVDYRILLGGSARFEVDGTANLYLNVTPKEGQSAVLVLQLDSPGGVFAVTTGCQIGPNELQYGIYVIDSIRADEMVLTRYDSGLEYALRGKRIAVETTFFN